ncbi:MAG: efflux RND transporter periplasmic adaptor subunit, partial [Zoogloea sp.]|nr:efflux RND transporter periplasmic adaptor subunit [Zoogloea sp.]
MNQAPDSSSRSVSDLLKTAPAGRLSGPWTRRLLIAGGVLVLGIGAMLMLRSGGDSTRLQYLTEEVATGKLVVKVSATGTLQPTKSVDVGSELSGTLVSVLVDENDVVKKGQVLAQLDLSKLNDQVVKSTAAVASAEATVAQMQATVAESKASLSRLRQVAELSGGKVPAKTELETAEAALQRAVANEAAARAAVTQARAALKTDQTNVYKATIRSPVDGVVLTRKVEPGQTVVAAMTTPVLFNLAENLAQMELQVNVDEADVGGVKVGQPASFTVAAWPGRKFPATIRRVGLGSTTTDNVVTYKTLLEVRNDELALRPGMTATAEIITASRDKALLVPNAALRFTPPHAAEPQQDGGIVGSLLPRMPRQAQPSRAAAAAGSPQVWV